MECNGPTRSFQPLETPDELSRHSQSHFINNSQHLLRLFRYCACQIELMWNEFSDTNNQSQEFLLERHEYNDFLDNLTWKYNRNKY